MKAPRSAFSLARVLARVLAAEHAALERRPRRDAEAELARHRHQLLLDGALEQRVLDLQPDERRPAAEARDHVGLGDLPRRRVRNAEVAHLARAHEVLERRHRLLDRRVHVPVVQPVEVDVVGLQAPQRLARTRRSIDLRPEPPPFGSPGYRLPLNLVAMTEPVAPGRVAPDVVADDLLGVALGVEVGGVDEVAAELEVSIDDLLRLLDARAPAEVFAERHRAEAERADAQAGAAECHVVVQRHGDSFLVDCSGYEVVQI